MQVFPRDQALQLRQTRDSGNKNVQSFAKYDYFMTRDLAYGHVQVRMAERSRALRSGRSLLL